MNNFLIVDDHPIMRKGLIELIGLEDDFKIKLTTDSYDEALDYFKSHHPIFVILDLDLNGKSGLDLLQEMRLISFSSPILIFSMHSNISYVERSIKLGANGYFKKQDPPEQFVKTVKKIQNNKLGLSEELSTSLINSFLKKSDANPDELGELSTREIEVFKLLGHGNTTKEIAENLRLSKKTIDSYRENIKEKLGIDNSNRLIYLATKWHLTNNKAKDLSPTDL